MTRCEWMEISPLRQIERLVAASRSICSPPDLETEAVLARSWCIGLAALILAPLQSGLKSTDPREYHVGSIADLTLGGSN